MSILDELLFTELNLDLSEFVHRFRSGFPVILITRTGIDPSDDPLHCISAEEIYWISGIHQQKRIVAADIQDDEYRRYFSIPLDYHRKFQLVRTEGRKEVLGPPMLMQKIVEGMDSTTGPTKFVFANSNNIRVNYEGSKSRSQQIGTLKVIEKYEQKYLVGHTLYKNVMDMMPRSIPIYLDITVDVAKGFNGWNDATFKEWMRMVKELGRCNQSTTAKTCGEIIQFRELPECGVYDYIQPFNYLKTEDVTRHQQPETTDTSPPDIYGLRRSGSSEERTRESDMDISAAPPIPGRTYGTKRLPPIPSQVPNTQTVVGRRPRPAASSSSDVEPLYAECRPVLGTGCRDGPREFGAYEIAPYAESRTPISVFQPSLARKKTKHKAMISQAETNPYSECTPEPFQTSEGGLLTTLRYTDDYEISPYSESKSIFPKPLIRRDSNTKSIDTKSAITSEKLAGPGVYGDAMSVDTSLISDQLEATYTECRRTGPKELPTEDVALGYVDVDCSPPRAPTPTHLFQFKHVSEIPPGKDLSNLSVAELTHCLGLLGLSKYSDVFRENDVDGKLASELSIQTLVGSFNFSDFEAMKFTKFLKGWRPNVK